METRGLADTVKNYTDAIPKASTNYTIGVQRATGVIEKSKAAEELWKTKMQDAIARNARSKGLDKVTEADWKNASTTKGAANIRGGMTAGKEKYSRGMGEVLATLQGITLAPRTADVAANVTNRVLPIATTLHDKFKA